jgi:hypothetical protein
VPLFGFTEVVAVVFVGVFDYVAYRDVFERRDTNVPQTIKRRRNYYHGQRIPRAA